jgi:hypothetical protein
MSSLSLFLFRFKFIYYHCFLNHIIKLNYFIRPSKVYNSTCENLFLLSVFGLAFVVEVVVAYNPIMHKTQPQKLIFFAFHSFLVNPTSEPQPPPLTQTPSKIG